MSENLPQLIANRYRLEAKLGSGGMGVVYRAYDSVQNRAVAIKWMHRERETGDRPSEAHLPDPDRDADDRFDEADNDARAGRFLREAKNTARLRHANIVELYDFGRTEQGDLFFVMELLDGESLSERLRRENVLSVAVSVQIARQICAALEVAHAAGIVHRDLKPANVMLLRRAGRNDYVKVLDFGVAKSQTPDQQTALTSTGMLVGTIETMAPEQITGRVLDGRADIYALGILLYRMLTGKPVFPKRGVPAQIHAHLHTFPTPMTEHSPWVPGALDRVVLRCLAKKPEQRFESMAEVSRALAAAIEVESAPRPARPARLVDLEYDSDDALEDAEETSLARMPFPRLSPPETHGPGSHESSNDNGAEASRVRQVPSPPAPASTPPREGLWTRFSSWTRKRWLS